MAFITIGDQDATEGLSGAIYDQLVSQVSQAYPEDLSEEAQSDIEEALKDVAYSIAQEVGDDVNNELSFLRDEMVNLIDAFQAAQPTPQDGGTALKTQTVTQWETIKSRLEAK